MVAKGKDQAEPGISCQVFIKLLDCWAEITLLPFLSFTIYFNYIVSYAFLGHPKKIMKIMKKLPHGLRSVCL